MKVLYVSGYSGDVVAGTAVEARFLQKPVDLRELKRTISEMLGNLP